MPEPVSTEAFASLERIPDETPKAYEAFLAYINMGINRSLRKLLAQYKQNDSKPPGEAMLFNWSTHNRWQERLNAYLAECAAFQSQRARERMIALEEQAWKDYEALRPNYAAEVQKITEMVAEFDRLKIFKRARTPDPRDPKKEIETVYFKVNAADLERLVRLTTLLNKDLRTQLGLETLGGGLGVQVPAGTGAFKAYISFDPDKWPDKGSPPQSDE